MASTIQHTDVSSDTSEHPQTFSPIPEATSTTQTTPSESETDQQYGDNKPSTRANRNLKEHLSEAFSENILAKALRVATRSLNDTDTFAGPDKTPLGFPETVAQRGPRCGRYEYREPDFWTCGFFPGQLWALRERLAKYPHHISVAAASTSNDASPVTRRQLQERLAADCATWTEPLHAMANRTDTHDLGFIIMPALQREWELTSNPRSLDSILRAANSLATRHVPSAGVIRSWDVLLKKEISVRDMSRNVLVIIDSMCNLDLLFYAGAHGGGIPGEYARIAVEHARAVIGTHLRPEVVTAAARAKDAYTGRLYSTCHVANVDPSSGGLKWRWTAQGYANDSTWSRGQAWAVLGYAQTYNWTKDPLFLEVACGVAEYFLYRLETAPRAVEVRFVDRATGEARIVGRHVPLWDFDAPCNVNDDDSGPDSDGSADMPPRDSSAGVIAANGMLLLSQALSAGGDHALSSRFLEASIRIIRDTLDFSLASETARLSGGLDADGKLAVEDCEPGETFDGVLKNGTANNNENARRRLSDHGLVYGDYYLLDCGNRLMQMGLI